MTNKIKRIDLLKNSLQKKEAGLNAQIENHFQTVKLSNGQPLNDKRSGHATMKKWDKQNDAIRRQMESIEKTKSAIEREERKVANIEELNEEVIPTVILELVEAGVLTQWRKYPTYFFVVGVEKARIIYDVKQKCLFHKYYRMISEEQQRKKFTEVYNNLNKKINQLTNK